MNARCFVVVLGWLHNDSWVGNEIKLGQLSVLVKSYSIVFKREICEEKGVDVRIQVLSQLEQKLVLEGLQGN